MKRAHTDSSLLFLSRSLSLSLFYNSLVNFESLALERTTVFLALDISTVYFFLVEILLTARIKTADDFAISLSLSLFNCLCHHRMYRIFIPFFDFGNILIAKNLFITSTNPHHYDLSQLISS